MNTEQSFQIGIKAVIRKDDQVLLLVDPHHIEGSIYDLPGGRIDHE